MWTRSREAALDHAIRARGNNFQQLLHLAAIEATEGFLVAVTLKSRKVYVAVVMTSPNLSPDDQHVSLEAVTSGYRKPDTLEVVYTYPYPKGQRSVMTVPIEEIQSLQTLTRDDYRALAESED